MTVKEEWKCFSSAVTRIAMASLVYFNFIYKLLLDYAVQVYIRYGSGLSHLEEKKLTHFCVCYAL